MNESELKAIEERAEKATPIYPSLVNEVTRVDIPALVAEVRRLREALEFYANDEIYYEVSPDNIGDHDDTIAMVDRGETASRALAGE